MNHPFTAPREEDLDRLESRTRAACARAPTTSSSTAGSSARARSASTAPTCRSASSGVLGIARGGGPGAVRLPARRPALRRAAARRDRARPRPDLRDRGRRDVAARRHRVPEDDLRHRPHDEGARRRLSGAAARARPRAPGPAGEVTASRSGTDPRRGRASESTVWVGAACSGDAAEYLVSPSGPVPPRVGAAAAAAVEPIRRALAGRLLARPRDRRPRSGQDARRPWRGSRTPRSRPACGATTPSSPSAAASSPTWSASRRRSCCAASPGTRCRRRRPEWRTRRSAARRASTTRAARTCSARSIRPRAILIDPAAAATLPDRDYRAGLVEAFKDAWIGDARAGRARRAPRCRRSSRARRRPLLDLLAGAVARQGGDRVGRSEGGGAAPAAQLRPHARPRVRGRRRLRRAAARRGRRVGHRGRARDLPRARRSARIATRPRCARCSPRLGPFPDARARRGAACALPRARQEVDGARPRRASCSSGNRARARSTRPSRRRNGSTQRL